MGGTNALPRDEIKPAVLLGGQFDGDILCQWVNRSDCRLVIRIGDERKASRR